MCKGVNPMKKLICLLFLFFFLAASFCGFAEENVLHIGVIAPGDTDNPWMEKYSLENIPGLKIVYHIYPEELLKNLIVSNKLNVDVLILYGALRDTVGKSGILLNLYELLPSFPAHYGNVKHLFETDGQLYGIPRSLFTLDSYTWNEKLGERLGITKPSSPWDFKDMLDIAEKTQFDIDGDGVRDAYLISGASNRHYGIDNYLDEFFTQYLYQYALHGKPFSDPKFFELLEISRRLLASGAVLPLDAAAPQYNGNPAFLLSLLGSGSEQLDLEESASIVKGPVVDKNDPAYYAGIDAYCLLRSSPNIELAKKWANLLLSPDFQEGCSELSNVFSPEAFRFSVHNFSFSAHSIPFESGGAKRTVSDCKNYTVIDYSSEEREALFPEEIKFAMDHAISGHINIKDLYAVFANGYREFLAGNQTAEQLAGALDEALSMVLGE